MHGAARFPRGRSATAGASRTAASAAMKDLPAHRAAVGAKAPQPEALGAPCGHIWLTDSNRLDSDLVRFEVVFGASAGVNRRTLPAD
jgi:hypothetical protein